MTDAAVSCCYRMSYLVSMAEDQIPGTIFIAILNLFVSRM